MDLSKLCSSKEDENLVSISSSNNSNVYLPPISEIQQQDTNNENNQMSLFQNNEYRQRYHLQHRHLKDIQYIDSSRTQQQQNYLPPCPPNVSHSNPPFIPSLSTTTNDINSFLIQNLLEQCSSIYSRIGKYRVDPLTESERSQIIDQVYYTTEKMLTSIKQLQSNDNNNNNNNNNTNDSTAISIDSMSEVDTSVIDLNQSTENTSTHSQVDDMDEYKMIRQARNLQDNNSRPKYRRRSKRSMIGQRCHSCNTTETPEWRRGPDGARTLCNACGLHYSKLIRKGSMTVQTHNYLLEAGSSSSSTSTPITEFKRAPRIIQFPIIQVNSSTNQLNTSTPNFLNNNRITEIHDIEDNNNKDVG